MSGLIEIAFWMFLGAFLAWNLVPQPAYVKNGYTKLADWIKSQGK